MTSFVRFPHTPHLAWLGSGQPRDDKVLLEAERREFLAHELLVEEKVDGANIGFSVNEDGRLLVQSRGAYLTPESAHPQFKVLSRWLAARRHTLEEALGTQLILFGEWCYAVHSIRYTKLPDWFLAFDVYDRVRRAFLSPLQRDFFLERLDLAVVPRVAVGCFTLSALERMLGPSLLGAPAAEGFYLRTADGSGAVQRSKLVRAEFTQAIGEHWSRRALKTNSLAEVVAWR